MAKAGEPAWLTYFSLCKSVVHLCEKKKTISLCAYQFERRQKNKNKKRERKGQKGGEPYWESKDKGADRNIK